MKQCFARMLPGSARPGVVRVWHAVEEGETTALCGAYSMRGEFVPSELEAEDRRSVTCGKCMKYLKRGVGWSDRVKQRKALWREERIRHHYDPERLPYWFLTLAWSNGRSNGWGVLADETWFELEKVLGSIVFSFVASFVKNGRELRLVAEELGIPERRAEEIRQVLATVTGYQDRPGLFEAPPVDLSFLDEDAG